MENAEITEFLSTIQATQNFSNSYKQIHTLVPYKDEQGREQIARKPLKFAKNTDLSSLSDIKIYKSHDYYISKNSCYANECRTETLFALDNIVIDIDNHGGKGQAAIGFAQLDYEVDKLLYILDTDYYGKIPEFNAVKTGRGLQLWIGLQSCSSKLIYAYQSVTRSLCELFDKILLENEILLYVDVAASVDAARVVRVPSTYNSHRKGFKTSFIKHTDYKYSIEELMEQYASGEIRERKRDDLTRKADCKTNATPIKAEYSNLHRKRCAFIERLIYSAENNIGRRDKMLFLWYNAAVQIMDREKATERLEQLNAALAQPLRSAELYLIVRYIDKKSSLNVKNSTFAEWLDLSTEERQELCTSERELSRRNSRNKKVSRDREILRLWSKGLTQQEIAEQVGCSLRTVKSQTGLNRAERDRRIKDYHDNGCSLREIAILCSCSVNTVRKVLSAETPPQKQATTAPTRQTPSQTAPPRATNKKIYTKANFALFDTVNHNTINQRGKWENDGRTQVSHYQAGCGRAGRDETGDTAEAATQYGIVGAGRTPYRES